MEEEKKPVVPAEGDDWEKFCRAFDMAFFKCLTQGENATLFLGDGEGGGVQVNLNRKRPD